MKIIFETTYQNYLSGQSTLEFGEYDGSMGEESEAYGLMRDESRVGLLPSSFESMIPSGGFTDIVAGNYLASSSLVTGHEAVDLKVVMRTSGGTSGHCLRSVQSEAGESEQYAVNVIPSGYQVSEVKLRPGFNRILGKAKLLERTIEFQGEESSEDLTMHIETGVEAYDLDIEEWIYSGTLERTGFYTPRATVVRPAYDFDIVTGFRAACLTAVQKSTALAGTTGALRIRGPIKKTDLLAILDAQGTNLLGTGDNKIQLTGLDNHPWAPNAEYAPTNDFLLKIGKNVQPGTYAVVLGGTYDNADDLVRASGGYKIADALRIIPRVLAVDGNRDGTLTFDADDTTTAERPWRWWINDDKDRQGLDISTADEDFPASGGNASNSVVDGKRDVIDFFSVGLDVGTLSDAFPASDGYKCYLYHPDQAVNFVWSNVLTSQAKTIQTDLDRMSGFGSSLSSKLEAAMVSSGLQSIPQLVMDLGGKVIVLVEGVRDSKKPLKLRVCDRSGAQVLEQELPLSISKVEQMYRWINLRSQQERFTSLAQPEGLSDDQCSDRFLVFIHGFRQPEREVRAWNADLFKRMYQSGMKAKFVGVTWHSDLTSLMGLIPNYYNAVEGAFKIAGHFAEEVNSLPVPVTVMAHSLGNMVVSSAIQDHNFRPQKYLLVNAAVASEAYDPTMSFEAAMQLPPSDYRIYKDQNNQPLRAWSTEWFRLAPDGDRREKMTWRGFFGNVPQLTSMVNFCSSGENVLRRNEDGYEPGIWRDVIGAHEWIWVAGEMGKGRSQVASLRGGWSFSVSARYYDSSPESLTRISPADLALVPDSTLFSDPFFAGYSRKKQVKDGDVPALHWSLANEVPALSWSVGSGEMVRSLAGIPQINMNSGQSQRNDNGYWPSIRLQDGDLNRRWLHSDFIEPSYQFNGNLYKTLISQGGL